MALFHQAGMGTDDLRAIRVTIEEDIHRHREWYLVQGSFFLFLGLLAAVWPGFTAMSAAMLIGTVLVVSGIARMYLSMRIRMHWWSFLSAALAIIIGGWLLVQPVAGLAALVMVMAIFLTIQGVFEILLALQYRGLRRWGWLLAAGIVSLLLAVVLWSRFPVTGIFFFGMIIAINLIFYGLSLIMIAA